MSKRNRNAVDRSQVKAYKTRRFKDKTIIHCYLCEFPLIKSMATVDHVIPLSKGGYSKGKNFEICCLKCNRDKGDKMPEEISKS